MSRTKLNGGGIPQSVCAPAPRSRVGKAPPLHAVHQLVSQLLVKTHGNPPPRSAGKEKINRKLLEDPAIRDLLSGVSVGAARPRSGEAAADRPPGAPALRLYVNRAASREELGELVHEVYGTRALKQRTLPVEIIPAEPARFLSNLDRMRPAACGLSCSNGRGGPAGSMGFLARGRGDGKIYLVSNNHVLANANRGAVGDPIVQPAMFDGGNPAKDSIATLFSWVTIDPSGPNFVDCAAARVTNAAALRPDFVQFANGGPNPSYFRVGTKPSLPGPRLGKCGRTTEVKAGRLVAQDATLVVRMGGRRFVFRHQIEIANEKWSFSEDGDSGALVWNFDEFRQPVGLLFASMGEHTFANPIGTVLKALQVDIIGGL
jgi:hypothetical protein